jgi:prepilin-type N-terminal cleavage/methylation domain-containing protein
MRTFLHKCRFGFTLAELLVVLGVLGVIATFTIPKILASVELPHKKAVFKETLAMMDHIIQKGVLQNSETFSPNYAFSSYILNNINAIKICNRSDDGVCTQNPYNVWAYDVPVVLLANGATLYLPIWKDCWNTRAGFKIDYNGDSPPNQDHQDREDFLATFRWICCGSPATPPGRTKSAHEPGCGYPNPESETFYQELWKP